MKLVIVSMRKVNQREKVANTVPANQEFHCSGLDLPFGVWIRIVLVPKKPVGTKDRAHGDI
ncbi:MAG: hypothetical protein DRH90_22080 [Deltaproteobacteria bacterium]|nr:MAG: hypothetical protein DRH90_22080 [Deltaproteobacteria bacterium]RLC13492.1 MAG: hypothetical protein DRI24_15615 [Deltaproteobacteria bacterium]